MWPEDVGMSVEEEGPNIRFLNCFVGVHENVVNVLPFHPNIQFCLGEQDHQKVARLGTYINPFFSFYHQYIISIS